MRGLIFSFLLLSSHLYGAGSSSSYPLDDVFPDLTDKESLQRGARTFVNYCMGCHEMKYQRFQRVAEDLDIPEEAVENFAIMHNLSEKAKNNLLENVYDELNQESDVSATLGAGGRGGRMPGQNKKVDLQQLKR